jgi:pimeloyl-ACP methyl ester carboxylesterase
MPIAADIYYHLYQEGEVEKLPVVLIHGAGGTHLHWPSQIRRMAGFDIYALDLPGHGKSDGSGLQSIQGYGRSVIDWLGVVGLQKAVFVGHSMGSAIALWLALEHPTSVLGLGLFGGASRLRVAPELLENVANPATFLKAVDLATTWSYAPGAPPELTVQAARRMAETRPAVLYGDFLACDSFDLTERLAEIQQPALVVCGELDRMTPLRSVQFLADTLPAGRLEVIPGAGHMVMVEQPGAATAALRSFLEGIRYSDT